MFTKDPSDKHYGERRPLSPGVHVERSGFQKAAAGSTTGSSDPRTFGVNPLNWRGYEQSEQPNRVMASPYGDTTVVTPGEGLSVQRKRPQQVVDSRWDKERPNQKPLGMSTGVRLGGGPQRNVPRV